MKKTGAVLMILLLLFQPKNALAETENEQAQQNEQQASEEEFEAGLQQTINGLNLYDLQKGLSEDETAQELLQSGDFTQTLIALGKGEKALDAGQIFAVLGRGLIRAVRENIQWMVQMILLCCVMSLLGAIGPRVLSGEVAEVCGFLSYALAVSLAVRALVQAFSIGSQAILEMTQLMQAMFPVLITLLTAVGSLASAGVFQPAMGF